MELGERMSRVAWMWVRVQWFRRRSSSSTRIRSATYNDKLAQLNWGGHICKFEVVIRPRRLP
jgi:hypothetical protein